MNIKSRFGISFFFILWLTGLLAAFFVVQKPSWVGVLFGLTNLFSTVIIWLLFVFSSMGLGYFTLHKLIKINELLPYQKLIFSLGLGMGGFGISGFLVAVSGLGHKWFLLAILVITLLATWLRYRTEIVQDYQITLSIFLRSLKYAPRWVLAFSLINLLFSFILSLAYPIEAFDGLLYHLTVPAWWLRDGSIQLVDLPHYWFPSLIEGMFVFPLSFGLDSTPQLIHWTFALLTFSLVWGWTQELFGTSSSWWTTAIALSMPSLPWLASWAYTDYGLTYYSLSTLFVFSKWQKLDINSGLLVISGIFCGFAVGIKYTAFILPVTCCAFLLLNTRVHAKPLLIFISAAFWSGGIWYLRNLIWMGNPVYPFIFGGPFWDSFRTEWYSGSGTGLNVSELLLLPFITTLGFRDENFFDGRIGPFYLILLPLLIFTTLKINKTHLRIVPDIKLLSVFGFLNIFFWCFGVVQTSHLMQARLLLPGIITLLPIFGKSISNLALFETSQLRPRFIFSSLMALTVFVFTLDFLLLVLFRNPVIASINSNSRISYTQRFNPTYAEVIFFAEKTELNAYIYFINEPRSYDVNRFVQPDPINDNLFHDFYLYSTNIEVLSAWRQLGYTHLLMRKAILDIVNQHELARLLDLQKMLIEIESTNDYILYRIP